LSLWYTKSFSDQFEGRGKCAKKEERSRGRRGNFFIVRKGRRSNFSSGRKSRRGNLFNLKGRRSNYSGPSRGRRGNFLARRRVETATFPTRLTTCPGGASLKPSLPARSLTWQESDVEGVAAAMVSMKGANQVHSISSYESDNEEDDII